MPLQIGQSSGDYFETQRRIQPLYIGVRVTGDPYTPDSFTQVNPPNVTTHVSTRLSGITTRGVLGGSIAFIRPDVGNGYVGGPPSAYNAKVRVLGLFIADASGVPFENQPSVASGEASYYADGGTYATLIYETFDLNTGTPIVWSPGDELYASKNGFITNAADDNNTYEQSSAFRTLVGIVKYAPVGGDDPFLVFAMRH